jgi:hypothetical protein
LGALKPKGLNRIAKIGEGHLTMLENLTTQHFLEGRKESGSIWIHFGKIGKYFHENTIMA